MIMAEREEMRGITPESYGYSFRLMTITKTESIAVDGNPASLGERRRRVDGWESVRKQRKLIAKPIVHWQGPGTRAS
jgi:hypothetical protein